MPIYEYKCINCGKITEHWNTIENRNMPVDCEYCGSVASRVQSVTSFILSGSGWGRDGYSNTSKTNSEKTKTSNNEKSKHNT